MKLLFRFFRRLPWFLASLTVLVGILLLGVSLLGRHPLYEELPDFDYRSKVLELMESGRYAEAETLIDDLLDCHWYADRHELEVWRTYCRKSRPGAAAAFAAGFLTGSVDSAGAASGAIVGDLLIWGDLRDLAAQGFFLASGQETDPWLSALSALGLATEIVPQGDMLSSGLKVLRKAGALSPKLVRRVISAAGKLAKGTLSAADRKLFAHLRLLLDKCGLPRCRTIFKVIDSDKKAAALARAAGIPTLLIGLTVVAFGTSAPELVVSIDAASRGADEISIGNVVGSNICNIALILGVSALVRPLPVNRSLFKLDMPVMIGSSLLLLLWGVLRGGISSVGGAVFCVLLVAYLVRRFYNARHDAAEAAAIAAEAEEAPRMRWYLAALLTVLAAAMLIAGGKLFVDGAVEAARLLKVSEAVIGLTVVALGTSLPELATGVAAAWRGECDIAVGNVVGSNIFNILCILGISPLVSPLRSGKVTFFDFGLMAFCSLLLYVLMRSGKSISRPSGGALVAIYLLYMAKLALRPEWGGVWR